MLQGRGSGLQMLADVATGLGTATKNVDETVETGSAALSLQAFTTGPRSARLKRKTPEWPSASLSYDLSGRVTDQQSKVDNH